MTLEELREFIGKQHWIFAKTYADRAPHEYMLLEKLVGEKVEYYDFVRMIREKGVVMQFWRKENRYIYLGGHMYWVMDPDPEKVILINRCKVEDYEYIIIPKTNKQEALKVIESID